MNTSLITLLDPRFPASKSLVTKLHLVTSESGEVALRPLPPVAAAVILAAILLLSPLAATAQTASPDTTTTAPTPAPLTVPTSVKPSATTPALAPQSSAIAQADIRDIRGPKPVPTSPLFYLAVACGALAAAAAGWFAYDWWKNRPRTPAQIALARLEKARALMTAGKSREFSIEVSEIIRRYIETRFQVFAMNRTTEEFLHDLMMPSDALLSHHQDLLGEFLQHCDLVKFARWDLSTEDMNNLHRSACDFVTHTAKPAPAAKETKPAPQPASSLININA